MPTQPEKQKQIQRAPQSNAKPRPNLNPQYSAEEEAKLRERIRTTKSPLVKAMAEDALLRMGCKP